MVEIRSIQQKAQQASDSEDVYCKIRESVLDRNLHPELFNALLEADRLAMFPEGASTLHPNQIMKEAIKQGNKNISLTTLRLKKKQRLKESKEYRDYQMEKLNSSQPFTPISYQSGMQPHQSKCRVDPHTLEPMSKQFGP